MYADFDRSSFAGMEICKSDFALVSKSDWVPTEINFYTLPRIEKENTGFWWKVSCCVK